MARLSFGVCFAPDPPPSRWVDLTRLAERWGFEYAWLFDSHVLWHEVYPIFTLMAAATTTIKIGPCVTNPATRDPTVTASVMATLNEISHGRMVLGMGRGDSAQRVLGRKPVPVEDMEEDCRVIRALAQGQEASVDGRPVRIKWAHGELPIWVAGYGPKALRAAGRVADGVIIQLADPAIIRWCLRFVREGAEEAGRDFSSIQVQAAAPAFIADDLRTAREQVRWFPALVSNHVVDLLKRYDPGDLPAALTDYIKAREDYDYDEHAKRGAAHAEFVPDDVVDRFCVIGNVAQSLNRVQELVDAGVHQFNLYLMVENPQSVIETYGREIIPHFQSQLESAASSTRG
ncbi:MAG TPA: TIGR03842 family LLM class F420-dependent oxidoreductase [Candidatus Limnocylindrales bacterium]|nr:TIGR03842 family LLM class F420-dependent oxidoreductase [Candidatus Limnocylindrales bacterium]